MKLWTSSRNVANVLRPLPCSTVGEKVKLFEQETRPVGSPTFQHIVTEEASQLPPVAESNQTECFLNPSIQDLLP